MFRYENRQMTFKETRMEVKYTVVSVALCAWIAGMIYASGKSDAKGEEKKKDIQKTIYQKLKFSVG